MSFMAAGFVGDIERLTLENSNFRKVIYTAEHSQLVLMSLKAGEEIGMETHPENDQFIRIEKGEGRAILNGNGHELFDGVALVIPAGTEHNIINDGEGEMKLYTIYSPAHHAEGTIHATREEALKEEE